MSATISSSFESSGTTSNGNRHASMSKCSSWGSFNIAAMVLGFVFFWPVGLVILMWIWSGRNVQDLPAAVRDTWQSLRGYQSGSSRTQSDNSVFNDYQQTQVDRIRELEDELRARTQRFEAFRESMKRRADKEEFDRFMASNPADDASVG